MTTHVTDDTPTIKASAGLSVGGEPSGTEKFKFWIDSDPSEAEPDKIQPADFSKNGRTAEYDYPLKSVPPDKSYYEIRWVLFVGEEERQQGPVHHFQVWPARGSLTVKDTENGSEVNDFQFKVAQDAHGNASERNDDIAIIGQNGKYSFNLHAGAEYSIKAKPPWVITDWVEGTANSVSQREVKAQKKIKAEFIKPYSTDLENPTLKQYVNLTTSDSGRDAKGHEVTIEVGVKGDRAKAVSNRVGGPGLFVHFEVSFSAKTGEKSKRNDPKTEVKDPDHGTVQTVEDSKKYKGEVELKSGDKTGKFKVELGYAGGDKCEIKIGGTDACEDARLIFINWRKLEYELLYPDIMTNLSDTLVGINTFKDLPAKIKAYAKERLGDVYVEYDLYKSHSFSKTEVETDLHWCFSDSEFLEKTGNKRELFYLSGFLKKYFMGEGPVFRNQPRFFPKQFNPFSPEFDPTYPQKFDPLRPPSTRMRVLLAHQAFSCKQDDNQRTKKITLKTAMTEQSYTFNRAAYCLDRNPKTGAGTLHGLKWRFEYQKSGVLGKKWTNKDDTPKDSISDGIPDFVTWESPVNQSLGTATDIIFKITELNRNIEHDIHFKKGRFSSDVSEEVSSSQKKSLKRWMSSNFNEDDKEDFRQPAKKARVQITGNTNDNIRVQAVIEAVQKSFDESLKICNQPGRDWNGKCKSGNLELGWFAFETYLKLKLTLPATNDDDPGNFVEHGRVCVEFEIDQCHCINGSASQTDQILTIPDEANDSMSDKLAGSKSATVCHELGHRMGMTIMDGDSKVPPGMPDAKHVDNKGDYYIDVPKGPYKDGKRSVHRGPHCAHGVSNKNKKKVTTQAYFS